MSIPQATLVSALAVSALGGEGWAIERKALELTQELSRGSVLAVWFLDDGDVVAVPRPDVSLSDGRLHSLERAAVRWLARLSLEAHLVKLDRDGRAERLDDRWRAAHGDETP